MHNKSLLKLLRLLPFSTLLLYFGNRSLVAYDEGFYALQSKWILENNNWITPTWWGNINLDRTIGIQYLIAASQTFFGESFFSIYIPNILAGSLMLLLTYKIHQEILGYKDAIVSVLILATSFLWLNYYHMATQDIIFSSLVTLGIFSAIKLNKKRTHCFYFLSGAWIGLAFMMKTYLVVIPFLGFFPFYIQNNIYKNKYFYLGFLIGFLPFFIWSYEIITSYNFETFNGLYSKLLVLSKNNNFTNPFYYYLWNIPLNTFPWFFFSLFGFYKSFSFKNSTSKYFLFKFPLIIIFLLSLFSTKTPYYAIQIVPLISINSYIGIKYILSRENIITKYFKIITFSLFPVIIGLSLFYANIFIDLDFLDPNQKFLLNFSLLLFIISWSVIPFTKFINKKTFLIILGPYLLFSTIVQSGLLSDRSKDIRIASESIIESRNLNDHKIQFITEGLRDEDKIKKLIKIALFMPEIGNGIRDFESLGANKYAWTFVSLDEIRGNKNLELIYDNKVLHPWKLILKKKSYN